MKNLTKVQLFTILSLLAYAVWEVAVQVWAKGIEGPIIRVDLIFIYPILLVLVIVSIIQFVKRK